MNGYDTLENVGINLSDIRLMAEETIRIGGGESGVLAGTHSLTVEDVVGIFEEVYSDK
ncbi:hypothetical protein [Bacillus sp. FJAT-45350]|uniref:hypothetical protein n=1 Tax=Bacillus sp. FJAT-45350 TaxID=2011014 RepID=UPI0015CB0ECB|nr:hypothetical protein [Bacillus sp. FJAT-45350]